MIDSQHLCTLHNALYAEKDWGLEEGSGVGAGWRKRERIKLKVYIIITSPIHHVRWLIMS